MADGVTPRIIIGVESWSCWEPRSDRSVCTSYSSGEVVSEELERPRLESIPPMQRRRLSPLARVAFHVLGECMAPAEQEPLIFSSVMGEIRRTHGIHDSLAAGDLVSPTAFSLSVHNSVAGLWSVIHGNKAPMLSLAPSGSSPVPALLEAAGILAEGRYKSVLVVYCEEDYPEFYRPFMESPIGPTATALRLVAAGPNSGDFVLSLEQSTEETTDAANSHRSFIELLKRREQRVIVTEPQARWQLAAVE
jgi:hypothetical protein